MLSVTITDFFRRVGTAYPRVSVDDGDPIGMCQASSAILDAEINEPCGLM